MAVPAACKHLLALEQVTGGDLLHVAIAVEVAELGVQGELHVGSHQGHVSCVCRQA